MMGNEESTAPAQTIIASVRARIGRRHRITATEMRAILGEMATQNLVTLDDWPIGRRGTDPAAEWTRACRGITIISVLADTDSPRVRYTSSNPGAIRFDEPGSMHPMLRATLMFAPATMQEHTYDYLRQRCRRLLIVMPEPS